MLDIKRLDQENVWKIVKLIRKATIQHYQYDLDCDRTLPIDYIIEDNIYFVEKKLHLNITSNLNENVTDETLKTAAEMFTCLNYCPNINFRYISEFLENLIKYDSAKNILLALTSIRKMSQNAVKESSTKILMKAMEIFKLKSYKDIGAITKENGFDDFRNNSKSCKEIIKLSG